MVGDVRGKTFTICGLAYKVGTNTLRRSSSVSLGDWLLENGAVVRVFDDHDVPTPTRWGDRVLRMGFGEDVLADTDVLVVGAGFVVPSTPVDAESCSRIESAILVLDAGRRWPSLAQFKNIEYVFVGKERNHND